MQYLQLQILKFKMKKFNLKTARILEKVSRNTLDLIFRISSAVCKCISVFYFFIFVRCRMMSNDLGGGAGKGGGTGGSIRFQFCYNDQCVYRVTESG